MQKIFRSKDSQEILKQAYLFKHFIIPNDKEDVKFQGVLKESYLNLIYSKAFKLVMPVFMKNLINSISQGVFNPLVAYGNLAFYTLSNVLMTFYDGKKIITNTKLI